MAVTLHHCLPHRRRRRHRREHPTTLVDREVLLTRKSSWTSTNGAVDYEDRSTMAAAWVCTASSLPTFWTISTSCASSSLLADEHSVDGEDDQRPGADTGLGRDPKGVGEAGAGIRLPERGAVGAMAQAVCEKDAQGLEDDVGSRRSVKRCCALVGLDADCLVRALRVSADESGNVPGGRVRRPAARRAHESGNGKDWRRPRAAALRRIARVRHDSLGGACKSSDRPPREISETSTCEFVPVCALVGAILSQDVLNAVGGKEDPIVNFFVWDGHASSGDIYALGLART